MTTAKPLSYQQIAEQLCDFLKQNILTDAVEVTPQTELAQIGVDSFALMELILFLERQFDLLLPAESLTADNIASVDALSRHCLSLLNPK